MAAPGGPRQPKDSIKHWKSDLTKDPKPPTKDSKTKSGTLGKAIRLRANYFPVKVKDWSKTLVHYDVVIKLTISKKEEEIVLSKRRKMEIFEGFKERNKDFFRTYQLAYDGMKSAVSVGVIPQLKDGVVYKVNIKGEGGKQNQYHVILKVVNKASLLELHEYLRSNLSAQKEFPAIVFQLIEIMFRHTPTTKYIPIGQNSFFPKNPGPFGRSEDISGDMVAHRGFFASLRPTSWKDGSLLLNVDVANAVFYKEQSVLDFMKENGVFHDTSDLNKPLSINQRNKLEKKLKNLKVRVTHSLFPRTYKVIGIMEKGANEQMFEVEKDKFLSVKDYFRQKYPRAMQQYPRLNVIRAAPDTKTVYLPIEFCHIAKGQKVQRQNIGSKEAADFMRFTAKPPNQRLQTVCDIARNEDIMQNQLMKDLEFSFSDKPIELTGRVLQAPEVKMNSNSAIIPFEGKWNIRDAKFFIPAEIKCWAVLDYTGRLQDEQIRNFVQEIIKKGRDRGMNISQPEIVRDYKKQPEICLPNIKSKFPALQLLVVVLSNKTPDSPYAAVKRIGDREIYVPTQCVLSKNVSHFKPATVINLLFKMNAKMGGINNTLGKEHYFVLDRPVMILGADVNHPPASDKSGTPSIAAVVGSLDKYAFNYAVEVRSQTSRNEMIEKLEEMTKSLLKTFYRHNRGWKPERIIMYRDGVSESQFLEVLAFELKALRAACTDLEKGYEPGITFIVVQKTHHTRFFPVNERDGIGKNKNVPPGTIVDTDVTHPSEIDFFLCSHEGIQGTSKPTHYRVLWDDNDFTLDQLETFSYAVCHLYARCARSVSIPTPAYYAHWAAYRGKIHLHYLCNQDNREKHPESKLQEAVKMDVENVMNKRMYFL